MSFIDELVLAEASVAPPVEVVVKSSFTVESVVPPVTVLAVVFTDVSVVPPVEVVVRSSFTDVSVAPPSQTLSVPRAAVVSVVPTEDVPVEATDWGIYESVVPWLLEAVGIWVDACVPVGLVAVPPDAPSSPQAHRSASSAMMRIIETENFFIITILKTNGKR